MENICPFFHFGGIYQQMHELDDKALLRQYAEQNSEAAFATLIERHVDKVYSVALRQTRNLHAAEEITQAVFVILAKKAGRLGGKVLVAGWLYETARLTALTYIRSEIRRFHREQEAHMQTALNENAGDAWPHIAPLLDDALAGLNKADRDAVVLRYFDGKSLGEVGVALGASEDAAKKRISRAVEKLRRFFTKRGVTLTATVLVAAISANSVQAAPASLAATVAATAVKGAVVSGSCLGLIQGALKIMAWTKAKMAMAVSAAILLVAGSTTFLLVADEKWFELDQAVLNKAPDNIMVIRPTRFGGPGKGSGMVGGAERIVGQNLPLEWGIVFANNFSSERLSLPEDFPKARFDFLFTLPEKKNYHGQQEVKNLMRDAIKKQFGYVAHRETRERDVLLLRIKNPNAAGLHKTVATHIDDTAIQMAVETLNSKNIPMYGVAQALEGYLGTPVFDQTGLTDRYAIDLRWDKLPGEEMEDTIKRVVFEDLGLELVPSREPVEMLVVEKVK